MEVKNRARRIGCGAINGLATYMLSFSRDQRLEKAEFKIIYSSLIADLKAIKTGFEKDKEYIPRFSSFRVFKMKGGYGYAPSEVCVALENLSLRILQKKMCRLRQIRNA
ncbi:hypothetical protein [Photobacterium damselae]|uniref:hypothetical protein n=1 Tax=Photobacterium damselae TaxID=38293 RepID=UPI00370BBDC5